MAQSLKVKNIRGRLNALLAQGTYRSVTRADRMALKAMKDGVFEHVEGSCGILSGMRGIRTRTPDEYMGCHHQSCSYSPRAGDPCHAWDREMEGETRERYRDME